MVPRWYSTLTRRAQQVLATPRALRHAHLAEAAREYGMHYHRRATMVHTSLPGVPEGGTARHLLSREPGVLTGRGLVWFELVAGQEPQPRGIHTVVTLDCPLSDALDSPAGSVQLETARQHARDVPNLVIGETQRGLVAISPGPLDLDRCAAMTAALRQLAANL